MKSFLCKKILTVPLIFFLQKTKKSELTVIYELPVRIVRFKISDDSYEVIATNLSEDLFSSDDLIPQMLRRLVSSVQKVSDSAVQSICSSIRRESLLSVR